MVLLSFFIGIGQSELDFFDNVLTQRSLKAIIGCSSYMNSEWFASVLFANLLTLPSIAPVFRREYKSGMYSVSSFYFVTWFIKLTTLAFHPVVLTCVVFYNLELKDESVENFTSFVKSGAIMGVGAVTFAHMWSTFFESEATTIISGFCVMQAFVLGSVKSYGSGQNAFRIFLDFVSPLSYTVEMITRCLLSGHPGKGFVLTKFLMLRGEDTCIRVILLQTLVYLIIGWLVLWYKCNYLY